MIDVNYPLHGYDIRKSWALYGCENIFYDGNRTIILPPLQYMHLCSYVGSYNAALDTLKEIIHHKITTGEYLIKKEKPVDPGPYTIEFDARMRMDVSFKPATWDQA